MNSSSSGWQHCADSNVVLYVCLSRVIKFKSLWFKTTIYLFNNNNNNDDDDDNTFY